MKQLELFSGLVPVQQYLHVWTEAERAARIKKEPGAEAQGEIPENRAQEGQTIAVCQRITQPPSSVQRRTHQDAACSGLPRSASRPESPGLPEPSTIAKWPAS